MKWILKLLIKAMEKYEKYVWNPMVKHSKITYGLLLGLLIVGILIK